MESFFFGEMIDYVGDLIYFGRASEDDELDLTRIIHRTLNFERLSNIYMSAEFPH